MLVSVFTVNKELSSQKGVHPGRVCGAPVREPWRDLRLPPAKQRRAVRAVRLGAVEAVLEVAGKPAAPKGRLPEPRTEPPCGE